MGTFFLFSNYLGNVSKKLDTRSQSRNGWFSHLYEKSLDQKRKINRILSVWDSRFGRLKWFQFGGFKCFKKWTQIQKNQETAISPKAEFNLALCRLLALKDYRGACQWRWRPWKLFWVWWLFWRRKGNDVRSWRL